jgi:hypothetical protein
MGAISAPRDDVFVSVCFADDADAANLLRRLEPLADALTAAFRYREILIAISEDNDNDFDPILARIANVRVVTVRRATPFYRRRVAIASEAIGDVVALCALEELAFLDVIAMIQTAVDRDSHRDRLQVPQESADDTPAGIGSECGISGQRRGHADSGVAAYRTKPASFSSRS